MSTAVIVALAACLALAAAGPYLVRTLPPYAAVRLLVPAVSLVAGCTVFVLGTVAFTWFGQLAEVAEFGGWSPRALRLLDPVPTGVSVAAGLLLVATVLSALATAIRAGRALLAVRRACRHVDDGDRSPVVVVDSGDLDAFTTPGLPGRIVVTTGMLHALDATGRRVLLAHEASHRAHGHTWWNLIADLAAAINPLLRPTAAGIRHAAERWADEDAAMVADRRLVAATIARIALLRAHREAEAAVVAGAAGGQVPQRVRALLRPPPRMRTRPLGVLLALVLAVLVGTFAVERAGESMFEHAEEAFVSTVDVGVPR